MIETKKIAVIVPAYKVAKQLEKVVSSMPDFVDYIVVVDDFCPEESGNSIDNTPDKRRFVLYNKTNLGVGGAVMRGYKKALELQADYIVKMDGDGQMNPNYLGSLLQPLLDEKADYTKGNRFFDFAALKKMPKTRLIGNSLLSFGVKVASGYWDIMDPTNGYVAITKAALQQLDFDKIDQRYFFETDMLINLYLNNSVVKDVPIPAKYEDEKSNLNISRVLLTFPLKMIKGLLKRVFFRYYVYDFNMASIYFLIAIPLLLFGIIFGSYHWIQGTTQGVENPAGTIMLAALPVILGIQFLLQAISIDIDNVPKKQ